MDLPARFALKQRERPFADAVFRVTESSAESTARNRQSKPDDQQRGDAPTIGSQQAGQAAKDAEQTEHDPAGRPDQAARTNASEPA